MSHTITMQTRVPYALEGGELELTFEDGTVRMTVYFDGQSGERFSLSVADLENIMGEVRRYQAILATAAKDAA